MQIEVQRTNQELWFSMKAVKGLSFTLNLGDFVGFIGGNGAGKSTTIKMLTGQLIPTSGTISIGEDCVANPQVAREQLGTYLSFQNCIPT